jgi:glycosyltransferase involved in cell wall biosynthesis
MDYLYKFVFYNSKVILLAEELHDDVSRYVDITDVIVIPNGMECSKDESQPSEKNRIKYCFLSNLVKGKGILDFLESYYLLYKNNNNVEALVTGGRRADGTELLVQDFLSDKQKIFIRSIEFTGALYDKDKYTALSSSDLFVFPSNKDAWGVDANEAYASGTPVITCPVVGAADGLIINGENGFVLSPNAISWASKTLGLLGDSTAWEKMSAKCLTSVTPYTYVNAAEGIVLAVNYAGIES